MGKGDKKLTMADLGLKAQPPTSFVKTKKEKKYDKMVAKKEKHQRVKEAISNLSEGQEKAKQHADFLEKEKMEEQQEKREHRMQLKAEHIKARRERDVKEAELEKEQHTVQRRIEAAAIERVKQETVEQREIARKIAEEEEERVKHAPKAVYIQVDRDPVIQETRLKLPVLAEEQPIVEAVEDAKGNAVVICGETGSGKTTQIPQFLWEAGYGHEEGAERGRSGMIAVTEPRRVAAISMAKRVAEELNVEFGGEVCYHVRYDNNLSSRCKMKFLTEGVLLKELSSDFLLRKYSVIIIDEAHERSVSCDILCGLLSRVVPLREQLHREDPTKNSPLKLLIMSATMRVTDFRDNAMLFPKPPSLINVEVRRFPVSNHFSRVTELFKYVDEANKKVRQVHKKLPPGGILVFLSTQREIDTLCRQLKQHYSKTKIRYESDRYGKHAMLPTRQRRAEQAPRSDSDFDEGEKELDEFGLEATEYALEGDEDFVDPNEDADDDGAGGRLGKVSGRRMKKAERRLMAMGARDDFDYRGNTTITDDAEEAKMQPKVEKKKKTKKASDTKKRKKKESIVEEVDDWGDEGEDRGDDDEEEEEEEEEEVLPENEEDEEDGEFDTLHILPLYSLLSTEEQHRVFEDPPPGKRLCVIATNVAETSITIPNIKYVIDAGRVKTKMMDPNSGASVYKIQWVSQASAEQRAGRAGRTGPGHCYRLYSTAVFSNRMEKHSTPEILRTPLESVILMMKALRIDHVGTFPFPTAPSRDAIADAMRHLIVMKAIEERSMRITQHGQRLTYFPVAPRYAQMVLTVLKRMRESSKPDAVATCILSAVAVASTTTDIFVKGGEEGGTTSAGTSTAAKELRHAGSDMITFARSLSLFLHSRYEASQAGLVIKSMQEAAQLKRQLEALARDLISSEGGQVPTEAGAAIQDFDNNEETVTAPATVAEEKRLKRARLNAAPPMSRDEEILFRQIIANGLVDQVARRATAVECKEANIKYQDNRTTKVPYFDFRTSSICFIHPSSSVAKTYPPPEFVVYSGLQRSRRVDGVLVAEAKTFMKGVTLVTRQWLDAAGFVEDAKPAPIGDNF